VGATVRETVNAAKQRFGESDLADLFKGASKVVAMKGKKLEVLHPEKDADRLADHVLGPTGNLRAPTVRKGKTFLVGFTPDGYDAHF